MKYIVYLTINIQNNKIYVGVHGTDRNDFDGYLGNGVFVNTPKTYQNNKTPFQFAVTKYGVKNFKRVTLKEFDNLDDALAFEALMVDNNFITRNDTYNLILGGGMPPLLNKVIYQYSLSGEFIKEWNTIVSAANSLGCVESCIGKAVRDKSTSMGYLWADYKVDKLNLEGFTIYSPKITVYQYNSKGEYERSFPSISETARFHNCHLSKIQKAISLSRKYNDYYFSIERREKFVVLTNAKLHSMPLHQYDLQGNFVKSFRDLKHVESEFGCSMNKIFSSMRLGKEFKDFQWSRDKVERMKTLQKNKPVARKIGQYTMENELVKVYNTVRECRIDFPNVSKVLKGMANHCKGYAFKYMD